MALAPLSQIVILTEDGSIVPATVQVTIPPPVVAVPLTITGTPPPTGTVGEPYSFTPTVTGGAGTRVYTLASGALLAGLTLSPTTGAITGTPTAAGAMNDLSVRVTDDTGTDATVPVDIVIASIASLFDGFDLVIRRDGRVLAAPLSALKA